MLLPSLALAAVVAFPWPDAATQEALDDAGPPDRANRQAAAERLGRIPEAPAGPPSSPTGAAAAGATARLRVLIEDSDPGVRLAAGRALARRQDPAAIAAATRWVVSGNAVERAAGFEVLRAARELPAAARSALERALVDADSTVKLMALEALADGNKDLRPSLPAIAGALDDNAVPVRLRAVRLLADARDPRAAPALITRTGDADRGVRREAIAALGALGDEKVVGTLLRLLESGPDDSRRAAIEALASLKATSAVPALAALARRRPADQVVRHAQWALGELGSAEALAALAALLREPPVSDETRTALARVGARAVPLLIAELDGDAATASAAAALLGRSGDRRALRPLLALARRRTPALGAALAALAHPAAAAEALPTLVQIAGDAGSANQIRRVAVDSLIAIGDDRAVIVLDALLAHADPGLRARAAALAGRLLARRHTGAVGRLLADREAEVRGEAVRALALLAAADGQACARLAQAAPALIGAESLVASALERAATPACLPALLAAAGRSARGPTGQALLRGVAAAVDRAAAAGGDLDRGALDLLVATVARAPAAAAPSAAAELAAQALGAWPLPRRHAGLVLDAFDRAPAAVRALLAPALASAGAAGRTRLRHALTDPQEEDEVKVGAAWALAGGADPAARAALGSAARSLHPALADNARAALAMAAQRRTSVWAAIRLTGSGSEDRLPGLWVRFQVEGVGKVWVRSGPQGLARISGVPAGRAVVAVEVADPHLSIEDPRDRGRKVTGDQVGGVERGARLVGRQPVDEDAGAGAVERR